MGQEIDCLAGSAPNQVMEKTARTVIIGKLFEADDDVVFGDIWPGALGHQGCTGSSKLFVTEHAGGAIFHIDVVASVNKSLGGGWGHCCLLVSEQERCNSGGVLHLTGRPALQVLRLRS